MNDELKIFELYLESAAETEEHPEMQVNWLGDKMWIWRGMAHRRNGPAVEQRNGYKSWWLYDKLHREDGPAVEHPDGEKEWWYNGVCYNSPKSWAQELLEDRDLPHDDAAVDAFLRPILKKGVEEIL